MNTLSDVPADAAGAVWLRRFGFETVVRLIEPMTPHLAQELSRLGGAGMLADVAWPVFDAALVVDDVLTIAVQVNGKTRGTIELPRDADKDVAEAAALELPGVVRALDGKTPKRVIVVPNRIVNVVG